MTDSDQALGLPITITRFGDPEPVLNNRAWFDYTGVFLDAYFPYYRTPIDLRGLANLLGANSYHGSIIHFKKNMLSKWYQSDEKLPWCEFEKLAFDYSVFGNCYLKRFDDKFGNVKAFERKPAIAMRRHRDPNKFVMLDREFINYETPYFTEYQPGEIIQLLEPDIKQEIYGVPEYIGGIQSVLLSEDSTLYRRKVFGKNGQQIGYILVTSDAGITEDTAKVLDGKIKSTHGPANMYINIPKTNSREPVKVIPLGSIETKDSYEAIKNITEREMLAMHRMQPGLSGIIPQNTTGLGDLNKVMQVYHELEVESMQQTFLALNEIVGEEVVKFNKPSWVTNPTP
jgi:PBSX family phage portal protein